MKKLTLPTGMHDKLFKRARVTYEMERDISNLLLDKGFHRIETPTLEHFEVFDDYIQPQHYHLFDKTGELLALRPDRTSQVGRIIASTQVQTPIKFSYSGKVFQYNEELRGLENESTQAGVEIVGYPAVEAVLEAIVTAKDALDVVQLPSYQFEFSHAAILQRVFEQLQISTEEEQELRELIQSKSMTGLNEFVAQHPSRFDAFISHLPELFGDSRLVLKEVRNLVDDIYLLGVFDEMEQVLVELSAILPTTTVDLGQVFSMPYYTGLTFKVFGDKVPDAFASGGRYDRLFERFGSEKLTAIGWAIDIDSIYQAVHDQIEYQGGER